MEIIALVVVCCGSAIVLWKNFSKARIVAAQSTIERAKADVVEATAKTVIELEKLQQDIILNKRLELEALQRERMKSIEAAATEEAQES